MTPERKEEIKNSIYDFYGKIFPDFPNSPELKKNPGLFFKELPNCYRDLESKNLTEGFSYKIFEAIAVDKFREVEMMNAFNNFFKG